MIIDFVNATYLWRYLIRDTAYLAPPQLLYQNIPIRLNPSFSFCAILKPLEFSRPLLQIEQLIEFGPFRPFFWSHFRFQNGLLSLMNGLDMFS
jgi:hypothetical protein